jgi:hypothetical protein
MTDTFTRTELNPIKLAEMLEELENTVELHSISVRYKGETVLEGAWAPFSLNDPQMMHSLSKIGTSICVGFAVDEGKLHLEDHLLDYVREELPAAYDEALEDITICLPCRQDQLADKSGRTQYRRMGNVSDCAADFRTGTASASERKLERRAACTILVDRRNGKTESRNSGR